MSNYRRILFIVVLLVVGVLACNGGAAKPTVEILSPPSGTQVALGEQVEVEYRASDATAVIRVDLEVDGQVVDSQSAPVAEGQPSLSGMLRWTPTEEGTYALLVYAYNRDRVPSDPVGVNIVVGEGAVPETTVTISLVLPGATETPTEISTQPSEPPTVTPTGPSAAPTATPTTRLPTATATRRPPTATATRRPPTATPTQPPPPATATPRPPNIVSFQANPSSVQAGNCTTLSWAVEGRITAVYLDGEGVGDHDSRQRCPAQTTNYRLRAVGPGGETTDTRTVTVTQPPMADLVLHNNSGVHVLLVRFWKQGDPAPGPDRLGNDVVPPGETYSWQVTPGIYSLVAEWMDGCVLDSIQMEISGAFNWTIPPASSTVELINGTSQTILQACVAQAGDWCIWENIFVEPGNSYAWYGIPPGRYDLYAEDWIANEYTEFDVAVCGWYQWTVSEWIVVP
jgi:hypothetical protein